MWYIHHVPVQCVPVTRHTATKRVTHSKCWGVLAHSPTPLKNTSILRQNLLHVKQAPNPRQYWLKPLFSIRQLSLKYKYKDRARSLLKKRTRKTNLQTSLARAIYPKLFHTLDHRNCGAKKCLSGGWPHCVKPSTPDNFLICGVVNH